MNTKEPSKTGKILKSLHFLPGCIIFLSIIGVTFLGLGYLAVPNLSGFTRDFIPAYYSEDKDSLDIVSIGSSAMYRMVNVPMVYEETGLTNYDLGSAALPWNGYINMLKEAQKTQEPQLYIIELRGMIKPKTNPATIRRLTNNMNASLNRAQLIFKAIKDPMQWDEYFLRLSNYHTQLFDRWDELTEMSDPEEMKELLSIIDNKVEKDDKGWMNIGMKRDQEYPLEFPEDAEPLVLYSAIDQAMDELLEYCEKENLQVLFVFAPYFCTEREARWSLTIENKVKEAGFECLNFLPMTEELGLDLQNDFYDEMHLNLTGSQKVTKYLCDFITETYDLKADHSEETIKEWDEYLERNKEDAAAKLEKLESGSDDVVYKAAEQDADDAEDTEG